MKTHLGWRVCLAVNETNSGIARDALYHHINIPQIPNRRERERERERENTKRREAATKQKKRGRAKTKQKEE
jgi:hypothetical protein